MKHQQVSVDYWTMLQTMFTYGVLSALCWIMLRLFYAVFTLPRRLRSQQENIQNTLQDLQKRFPDLNITEEDLLSAEKELDDFIKEGDEAEIKAKKSKPIENVDEGEEDHTAEGTKKDN